MNPNPPSRRRPLRRPAGIFSDAARREDHLAILLETVARALIDAWAEHHRCVTVDVSELRVVTYLPRSFPGRRAWMRVATRVGVVPAEDPTTCGMHRTFGAPSFFQIHGSTPSRIAHPTRGPKHGSPFLPRNRGLPPAPPVSLAQTVPFTSDAS